MNSLPTRAKPYLIGLTGSIGSGKSLVRKMLEHLGALTIDADELAHHAYQRGSPGYDALVKRFGSRILTD
jgi:dephospho-CoA kinase